MKEIKFVDLANYNDSNSFIIAGISVDGMSLEEIDEVLHKNWGLIPETKKLVGLARLSDNVLGDEGRTDILFELEGEGEINPMVRLQLRMQGLGIMWTSDFEDNYKKDYISA